MEKNAERALKIKKMYSLLINAGDLIDKQNRTRQEEVRLLHGLMEFNRLPPVVSPAGLPSAFTLMVMASELINKQNRTRQEEAKLFHGLLEFNRVPIGVNTVGIPSTFANRCGNCGGSFGDGFHCNGCQTSIN